MLGDFWGPHKIGRPPSLTPWKKRNRPVIHGVRKIHPQGEGRSGDVGSLTGPQGLPFDLPLEAPESVFPSATRSKVSAPWASSWTVALGRVKQKGL